MRSVCGHVRACVCPHANSCSSLHACAKKIEGRISALPAAPSRPLTRPVLFPAASPGPCPAHPPKRTACGGCPAPRSTPWPRACPTCPDPGDGEGRAGKMRHAVTCRIQCPLTHGLAYILTYLGWLQSGAKQSNGCSPAARRRDKGTRGARAPQPTANRVGRSAARPRTNHLAPPPGVPYQPPAHPPRRKRARHCNTQGATAGLTYGAPTASPGGSP
jgi:hypothetical protein